MRAATICALVACAALRSTAISISWTGYAGNGQWDTKNNWYPNQVPGPNDDVTISKGSVDVTSATGVNSLSMGDSFEAPANLTLFKSFFIGSGGMTVEGNGNLFINTGLQQVTGQVNIEGSVTFIDGAIGGAWTASSRATVDFSNAGEKALIGCTLAVASPFKLGGVLVLNQTSTVTVTGATMAKGTPVIIQAGDNTQVGFDNSKGSFTLVSGALSLQAPVKLGEFTLESGNVTLFSAITFNAALAIPKNSFVVAVGAADVAFPKGATGAGVLTLMSAKSSIAGVNMTGALNLNGGAVNVASSCAAGIVTIDGANVFAGAAVTGAQLNLLGGTTAGTATITGTNVYVKTAGITLGSAVSGTKAITFDESTLTFGEEGKFTVAAGAIAQTTGTLRLVGPSFIPGFVNNGVFTVTQSLAAQNIDVTGAGSLVVASSFTANTDKVQQKTISLAAGAVFKGANTQLNVATVAAKATGGVVKGVMGQYAFECPQKCTDIKTTGSVAPAQAFSFSA